MDKKKELKSIEDEIRNRLMDCTKEFLGRPIDDNFINNIKERFHNQLHDLYDIDYKNIDLEVKRVNDRIELIPKNLYTLLLLKGIFVPFELLEGLETYESDIGIFFFKDGKPCFVPNDIHI